jgi:hypothetical protein
MSATTGQRGRQTLNIQHVPQYSVAKRFGIPHFTHRDAPAIALPEPEHLCVTAAQHLRDTTGWSARQLLEDDIRLLRQHTEAPERAIEKLIQLFAGFFPEERVPDS